jgi:hypothetical protein
VMFPRQESSELHTLQFSVLVLFLLGTQFNHRCAGSQNLVFCVLYSGRVILRVILHAS